MDIQRAEDLAKRKARAVFDDGTAVSWPSDEYSLAPIRSGDLLDVEKVIDSHAGNVEVRKALSCLGRK